MTIDLRALSKGVFLPKEGTNVDPHNTEAIKLGCLQRMADAVEHLADNTDKMLQSFNKVKKERDYFKAELEKKTKDATFLRRSNATIRRIADEQKKELEQLKNVSVHA